MKCCALFKKVFLATKYFFMSFFYQVNPDMRVSYKFLEKNTDYKIPNIIDLLLQLPINSGSIFHLSDCDISNYW